MFIAVKIKFGKTSKSLKITAQKMKFSYKDFFSKCDQIRSILRIWVQLLKKPLMENLIFCAVNILYDQDCSNYQSLTLRCSFNKKKWLQ